MINVIVACGSGMGSSQIIKMKIEKVFKKLDIVAKIHHTNISEAKSSLGNYDVLVCSLSLVDTLSSSAKGKNIKIIGLRNLLSEAEIEEKVLATIVNT